MNAVEIESQKYSSEKFMFGHLIKCVNYHTQVSTRCLLEWYRDASWRKLDGDFTGSREMEHVFATVHNAAIMFEGS